MTPRASIVVPAYNEGEQIIPALDALFATVDTPARSWSFTTPQMTLRRFATEYARRDERGSPTLNTYGRGPARAIRFGMDHAQADVIVVTMADGRTSNPRSTTWSAL